MVSRPEFRAAAQELTGQSGVSELQAAFEAAHLEVPHARAKEQELVDLFREMQDAGDDSSVIGGRQRRVHRGEQGSGGSEQARRQNYIQQILLDIQDQIDRLSRQIRQLERHISDMKIAHDALRNGEMGVDDALRDKAVQRAIKAWEKRHGQKFDPKADNVDVLLVDILAEQMQVDRDEVEVLKRDKAVAENKLNAVADIEERKVAGEDIDIQKELTVILGEDKAAELKVMREETREHASEAEQGEQDLTGTFLAQWRGRENTPEFAAALKEHVADLEERIKPEILKDQNANMNLRQMVAAQLIDVKFSEIEDYKNHPDYAMFAEMIFSELPQDILPTLSGSNFLSADIRQYLPDENGQWSTISVASGMQNEQSSQAKINAEFNTKTAATQGEPTPIAENNLDNNNIPKVI